MCNMLVVRFKTCSGECFNFNETKVVKEAVKAIIKFVTEYLKVTAMTGKEDQVQNAEVTRGDLLPELQSVFKNIAKEEGYIAYDITTKKINSDGANYLGELFEVDIKGKTKYGEKETNLFLKKALSEESLGDFIGVASAYATENYVYQDLFKRFHELQNEANVPDDERFKMVKCYENFESTTIIFENMAKKAYRVPHRMDVMSSKYAELSIEQLAKFHALSFALKIKDPEYFENKVSQFKHPIKNQDTSRLNWGNIAKITMKDLDCVYKQKAEKVMAAFHEKYSKYFNAEYAPINCLCHGDFRVSNILMRENEGEVAEVVPLDYQIIYFGCPINDICFFIATGTDRKFRLQHFERLKNLYYDTLTNFLKYFDIDSHDVFPRKEFEHIMHQRMDFIAILAVICFPFLFASENTPNIHESMIEGNLVLDERYKERLIEILEDIPV